MRDATTTHIPRYDMIVFCTACGTVKNTDTNAELVNEQIQTLTCAFANLCCPHRKMVSFCHHNSQILSTQHTQIIGGYGGGEMIS